MVQSGSTEEIFHTVETKSSKVRFLYNVLYMYSVHRKCAFTCISIAITVVHIQIVYEGTV